MRADIIEIIVGIDAHHLVGTAVVGSYVAGGDTGTETGCKVALLEECAAIGCLVRNHAAVIRAILKPVVLIVHQAHHAACTGLGGADDVGIIDTTHKRRTVSGDAGDIGYSPAAGYRESIMVIAVVFTRFDKRITVGRCNDSCTAAYRRFQFAVIGAVAHVDDLA